MLSRKVAITSSISSRACVAGEREVCLSPTATATSTPSRLALSDFVVLGLEGVWLRAGSRVLSGHIGANTAPSAASLRAGMGESLEATTEVIVGQNVRLLDPDSDVYGDSLTLLAGARAYDVFYNDLTNRGTILGERHTPLALPLFTDLPDVPSFTPGTLEIEVRQNGTLSLDAGN